MNNEEEPVRKALWIPPSLWHRIKVDAVQQEIEISDIVVKAVLQHYGLKDGKPDGKAKREMTTGGGVDGH